MRLPSCRQLAEVSVLRVSSDRVDAPAELAAFEALATQAGGIVTFTGRVRHFATSEHVKSLTLQSYSPMTETGIQAAIDKANTRWTLDHVSVIHRVGTMRPGETIVFVATAAAHRRAAFEAADFLMDYLKTEAIFWKKEETDSSSHWIEPRKGDYSDAARWTEKETT